MPKGTVIDDIEIVEPENGDDDNIVDISPDDPSLDTNPVEEFINEFASDENRAKALIRQLLLNSVGGISGGTVVQPQQVSQGHTPRIAYVDMEGNPVNEKDVPPGTNLFPANSKLPGKKKPYTKADLEKGRMVRLRGSSPLIPVVIYNGLVYKTPHGKTVEVPEVVADIYDNALEEMDAFNEGRTIAPPDGDPLIPKLKTVGGFDEFEVVRTVQSIREHVRREQEVIEVHDERGRKSARDSDFDDDED